MLLGAGLIKDQTACRNRLAGVRHKLVKSQLKARLGHVEKQITQVDAELKRLIHKDESLKRSFTILTSIPGIGAVACSATCCASAARGRAKNHTDTAISD